MTQDKDNAGVIRLSAAEIQSNHDRIKCAEGLLLQLPEDHDGRNSWLLNYGVSVASCSLRAKRDYQRKIDGYSPAPLFWDASTKCFLPYAANELDATPARDTTQLLREEIRELRKQLGHGEYLGIPVGLLELCLARIANKNWLSLQNIIGGWVQLKRRRGKAATVACAPDVALNGRQLQGLVDRLAQQQEGNDWLDTEICIRYFDECPEHADDSVITAGMYYWFADYPDEGRIPLPDSNALLDAPICKCSMTTRALGDGCDVCNPELAAEYAAQAVDEILDTTCADDHPAERNWPEDSIHENGNYECLCSLCGHSFIGMKRRVVCKVCAYA